MLAHLRDDCLRQISWNQYFEERNASDTVSVFECWKFDGDNAAQKDVNWRFLNLYREKRRDGQRPGSNEATLQKWLRQEDIYGSLKPPNGNGKLLGGIRLVFCEKYNLHTALTISKNAFLMIEQEFDLHETTLPAFMLDSGTQASFSKSRSRTSSSTNRVYFVVKAYQKVEIINCTLSICYDVSTGFTTGFICGEGMTLDEYSSDMSGVQRKQFLQAILSNLQSWDNPLMVPFALLETVTRRLYARADMMSWRMVNLETEIGVTVAGSAGDYRQRHQWPEDVDTRVATKALHSESTQIIFLLACSDWMKNYGAFLMTAVNQMSNHQGMQARNVDVTNMQEHLQYLINWFPSIIGPLASCRDRANLQINVLFTIINQQAAITSRRDANLSLQVAKSSKQDAISVSTFTFITAMFLPGSFVATMFSMGMFNWQAGSASDSTDSPSVTEAHYVVDVYWIFWVVTVPLTVLTFIGWRVYSIYANKKWLQELEARKVDETYSSSGGSNMNSLLSTT